MSAPDAQGNGDSVPVPDLTYQLHDRGVDSGGVHGDGPPLHRVHEAQAWEQNGKVVVYLRGRILKKDGTPGKHTRSLRVYLADRQPPWLEALVEDAIERLLTTPHSARSES